MILHNSAFLIAILLLIMGCAEERDHSSKLQIIPPGKYIAEEDDHLSNIALRAYGDLELWYCLLNANPKLTTRPGFDLEPGEVITVPPKDELDHSLPKSIFPEALPADYIIMPGDSLTFIAKGCYGDPELWTRIYDANRNILSERVKEDPRQLIAGEVLRIPAPPEKSPIK